MRNIMIIFLFISFWSISDVQSQTSLETAIKKMNVTVYVPSYFNFSQNKEMTYVTKITQKDPVPTLAQTYRGEPSYGNTALKVLFGEVHSIIEHTNGEYLIFVVALPRKKRGFYHELEFGRIKHDFRYGDCFQGVSEPEEYQLSLKLTEYSREQAQKMFNANVMVSYPVDLEKNVYRDKYNRCRAVVIAKDGWHIFFYFMMTDENMKNFDTYLKDLNRVFWFNE
ncbi:hypothetical protein [Parabacteroides pacaensis]|uniref:hypothetical protein n=1 Tax=Parabacteroides pacaensis TaxID=2086575 RepID=UPI00131AB4DE|nr:hypothetical protein [Parabacteroides pacaensis]